MRVLLVIALAACSTSRAAGPAWPRPSAHDADGGESLEPHAAARTVTATAVDEDRAPDRSGEPRTQAPAPGAPAAASATAPAALPGDEVQPGEDIVIEIED